MNRWLKVLVICCSIVLIRADTCPQDELKLYDDIPSTGFSVVNRGRQTIVLRTKAKLNNQRLCAHLTFVHTPEPNHSPLMGENVFKFVPQMYNDHFAWSNGYEFISFVPTSGGKGNWLLGPEPGVDNGYVYKTAVASDMSPADAETLVGDSTWYWLQNHQWDHQPAMRMHCLDEQIISSTPYAAYEVEYFPRAAEQPVSSLLFPTLSQEFIQQLSPDSIRIDDDTDVSDTTLYLWDRYEDVFVPVSYSHTLAVVGEVSEIHSHQVMNRNRRGVYLSAELSRDRAWRLTFHLLPGEADHAEAYLWTVEEASVTLAHNGVTREDIASIVLARATHYQLADSVWTRVVSDTQSGDYLWLWEDVRDAEGVEKVEEVLLQCTWRYDESPDSDRGTAHWTFTSYAAHRTLLMTERMSSRTLQHVHVTRQFLPECAQPIWTAHRVTMKPEQLLIKPKPTPRAATPLIKQLQVDSASGDLVFQPTSSSTTASNAAPSSSQNRQPVVWHHALSLSSDPLSYLLAHLRYKEGKVGDGLSSCFMYHAAVSMPAPLVYAAEVLCLLLGAKPVVMVQLDSPSEHQWKFPLVQGLLRALSEHRSALGNALPVDVELFRHGADDTAVLYRKQHRWLLDALRPAHIAQALHPMPFPDPQNLTATYHAQIRNAAWNGQVLGYPWYFVLSYCESFHDNGLTLDEKHSVAMQTRQEFLHWYHHSSNHKHKNAKQKADSSKNKDEGFVIKMGLDEEVSEEVLRSVFRQALRYAAM